MKKLIFITMCLILLLAACNTNDSKDKSHESKSDNSATKTFKQDDGTKVKIPKNPKRIVVLHPTYVGALVKFDHKPVGVTEFVSQNKTLDEATKGIKRIGQGNVEQVTKTKPDLIITTKEDKNVKKLKKIAPTIQMDAMKSNYKETTKKLGEIVNEQDKADKWLKDWENKLQEDKKSLGDNIKGKTITVLQATPKGLTAFGKNYGRGTEIVYDGYGMKQPKMLEKETKNAYMATLSEEKLADYAGDYIILASMGQKPPFTQKENWKNLKTVKNGHVIDLNVQDTQYNDPISLEKQRKIIFDQLKEMK
ncbi:ABC transporter substrate-binding protein [Staphylococcus sp. SQ8-PEA]|uniref:ABC transporter substrate-binding protein n=1 Tax=Staphylococcus marylandisciuri TaxID=2981529 RepID=A0ABT2QSK8_9STAP|nr:ABC transporter substrate-binding protein [Staphylococcus marylandisciuri]MCU5746950.1 ABC transporter substrate-binding protein [Staphylococcus marylandisciuri]